MRRHADEGVREEPTQRTRGLYVCVVGGAPLRVGSLFEQLGLAAQPPVAQKAAEPPADTKDAHKFWSTQPVPDFGAWLRACSCECPVPMRFHTMLQPLPWHSSLVSAWLRLWRLAR